MTDKCKECNAPMVLSHNKLYWYCLNHPTHIKYDDKAWEEWIKDENDREWESLKRLEKE